MPHTTAFPHIPAEVFLHIFKHLSANADLCSASLTCRAVRDEAQRVLFHNPVPRTAYRHLLFIDAILSSPSRLGPMVKVFVHVSGSAYCEGEDEGLIEKTGKVLRAMCSLKRLAFQNARRLPASVLLGTTFQLDMFNWGSAHDNTVVLKEFLPTQKSLKHLTFHCNETLATPENVEITGGICPELRSLTGGRGAVKLFIKGKEKVTHLQFVPDSAQAHESWFPAPEVQVELERLRFLKFRPCDGRFNQLPRLVDMLHSLVLLELTRQPCEPDYNQVCILLFPYILGQQYANSYDSPSAPSYAPKHTISAGAHTHQFRLIFAIACKQQISNPCCSRHASVVPSSGIY